MKNLLLLFLTTFSLSVFAGKQVSVLISFENETDIPFESGELIIKQLNDNSTISRSIPLNSLADLTILLEKGKRYSFQFNTEDFLTKIVHPYRIGNKSEVQITLNHEVMEFIMNEKLLSLPDLHRENLGDYILETNPYLYFFGKEFSSEERKAFANKYGIHLENRGQLNVKKNYSVFHHNLVIYSYLNKKYGKQWQEDLPVEPYQHKQLRKIGL